MMVKVHIHTKRIFVPVLGIIVMFSLFYLYLPNQSLTTKKKIILQSSHLACVQPSLRVSILDEELYSRKHDPITCNDEDDWVTVYGHIAVISEPVRLKYGKINCEFTELFFDDDDVTRVGSTTKNISNSFEFVRSDFFHVKCMTEDGNKWENTLAGIQNNQTLKSQTKWETVPKDSVKFNVMMLGIDSLSRMNFMRTLPKTYRHLTKDLESNILEGYNIVGDGTPQALIPILTGMTELELPETRRRMGKNAHNVDVFPFIWKDFKKAGFVTLFAEDMPQFATFSYRLKGFKRPPTDHYMRPFFNHIYPSYSSHPTLCFRGTPRHKVFLNYIQSFFEVYSDKPKFSFAMHSELSFDDYNLITVADDNIVQFLRSLNVDDTIIVLFSDHGSRFSGTRNTQRGKQEERLPFVSIYLPPKFKELYPSAADNVRVNSQRLVTPFDLHPTLKDLTKFSGAKLGKTTDRGISLFSEIPPSRTCFDAFIEPHWCACLTWEPIMATEDKAVEASNALVHYINSYTSSFRSYCHEVKLVEVLWAALLLPNQGFLKFRQTADLDGFVPDLSGNTAITEEVYQISISTAPTKNYFKTSAELPIYEASLSYNVKQDTFSVKMDDVSRTTKFGDQPHCIKNTEEDLRKFCYCLQAPS